MGNAHFKNNHCEQVQLATNNITERTFVTFMQDAEFDAPPMVMLVGPYSVGKTSFIKYLLGREFPGLCK